MTPAVSVVICTYNRCESLRETLEGLNRQVLGDGLTLEIVVVDNNSTDRTRQVVKETARGNRWPVRYFFERRQGKTRALNLGVREAAGNFLAFTDDDVIPDRGWVQALHEACVTHQADCVGGKVLPLWLGPPPAWLAGQPRGLFGAFALVDRGDEPIVCGLRDAHLIYGANMGCRKDLFDAIGLFRTDLGPDGKRLLRGDDTDLVLRAVRADKRVVYAPSAVVRHKVPPERMRMWYLRRWKFYEGRTDIRMSSDLPRGLPAWLVRDCAEEVLRGALAYACGRTALGIHHELRFWTKLGEVVELIRPSRQNGMQEASRCNGT